VLLLLLLLLAVVLHEIWHQPNSLSWLCGRYGCTGCCRCCCLALVGLLLLLLLLGVLLLLVFVAGGVLHKDELGMSVGCMGFAVACVAARLARAALPQLPGCAVPQSSWLKSVGFRLAAFCPGWCEQVSRST
jgi:hypothetical protein